MTEHAANETIVPATTRDLHEVVENYIRLRAITSPGNQGSIGFHRSLGFEANLVADYNGPGMARIVFSRDL
ncbi:hypothetical protein D5S18_21220 [Nocardia panacis]|uniref:GNAT family N-acetyltransferase n=1 Tax=Nocardia panacis TaxID=2340916 RepID=A0A3A4KL45_9NOCA|nr:hypothetical protein [Nocardia panacis]RJO73697.1 hypothetical protein D5S18_21220 [Nocardia panacis]